MNKKTIVAAVAAAGVAAVAIAQLAEDRAPWWPAIDTTKPALFSEWYTDIPWHQKLGTYAGNEIDQAIVLPYEALGPHEKDFCKSKGLSETDCMLEIGVTNIVAVHRTDRLYDPADPKIKAAKECQDKSMPCVEVKLDVSQYWRRCQQIGLDPLFDKADNPFPWMAEMIDLKKEKNFFETRVIEYQTGGALSWD